MIANGKRKLRDGRAYDALFPKAEGNNETISGNANLKDTLALIPRVVREYGWQAAKIARKLKGRTLRKTCENIWEFCYGYIQYEKDAPGREQVRTPARTWQDRKADCDCFSVFISAILSNLAIPHKLRVTKYPDPYDPDPPYQHIYVIVPLPKSSERERRGYITIDPVTDAFDFEVPYLKNKDLNMELELLSGVPSHDGNSPPMGYDTDYTDLFEGADLALAGGMENSSKFNRIEREAGEKGMTIEQYKAWQRKEFIRRNGMTPEEFSANVRRKLAESKARGQQNEKAVLDKLKKELRKRGVAWPPNANRSMLLELLRSNPKPKTGGRVLNAINKVNPATVLLRTGVLLAMKLNYMGIAAKLRWALTSASVAQRAGMKMQDHAKLRKVWDRLRKTYYGAGGQPDKLMKAVLTGKGNKDRAVSLSGFPHDGFGTGQTTERILGPVIYRSEVMNGLSRYGGRAGLNGLGEAVSATAAIGAATAVLTAIAALLKKIKVPKGKQNQQLPTDAKVTADQSKFGQTVQDITKIAQASTAAMDAFSQVKNGGAGSASEIEAGLLTDDGFVTDRPAGENLLEDDDEPKEQKGVMAWLKKNPLPALGIGVAVVGGTVMVVRSLKKKGKALSGVRKGRQKSGTTRKTTTRKSSSTRSKKTTTRRTTTKKKPVNKVRIT